MGTRIAALRRPRLLWLNAALTLVVVGTMIAGIAEPVVIFMLGTALALVVNTRCPPNSAAASTRTRVRR